MRSAPGRPHCNDSAYCSGAWHSSCLFYLHFHLLPPLDMKGVPCDRLPYCRPLPFFHGQRRARPAVHGSRRPEHDLRTLCRHHQEGAAKGPWRYRRQDRLRGEDCDCDIRRGEGKCSGADQGDRRYRLSLHAPQVSDMTTAILETVITCPHCGFNKQETMPTDACQFYYECDNCKTVLRPKAGDCCVNCSYGSVPCPPIQEQRRCCG